MAKKQFNNLSKKDLIEMANNYVRQIKDTKRFYNDAYKKEINNYIDGIKQIQEIIKVKHNGILIVIYNEELTNNCYN